MAIPRPTIFHYDEIIGREKNNNGIDMTPTQYIENFIIKSLKKNIDENNSDFIPVTLEYYTALIRKFPFINGQDIHSEIEADFNHIMENMGSDNNERLNDLLTKIESIGLLIKRHHIPISNTLDETTHIGGKSRKHKSKKHKSRKHKSRKHKSRKHKSKKHSK